MNRADLLDQLTEDILAYVMHGAFPERDFAATIKPEGLDDRFNEYERLLDLHFLLTPDVVDFVEQLPQRVRTLNTDTESVSRTRRGAIDGTIDWASTIKQRYSQTPGDRSLFVCSNRTEDYDTAENLVFKRLISIIYDTLREAEEYLQRDYPWVTDRWDETRVDSLQRIVEQNVHVRRIRDPDAYEPTDRMLNTALESRQAIYRDAASLLQTRRALFAGEREQLEQLLSETAITPEDDDTLLELFVLFRFIAVLESVQGTTAEFETMKPKQDEVARVAGDDGAEIVVYHNSSASDRGLSFRPVPDADQSQLSRTEKVHTKGFEIANEYFKDTAFQRQSGRPDLLVMEITTPDAEPEFLITEVKNSTNTKTIRQGIKETLEYLAFLRRDEAFVFGDESHNEAYFGDNWNGLLVIQDLGTPTQTLAEQSDNEIKILQASELETELKHVLEQLS